MTIKDFVELLTTIGWSAVTEGENKYRLINHEGEASGLESTASQCEAATNNTQAKRYASAYGKDKDDFAKILTKGQHNGKPKKKRALYLIPRTAERKRDAGGADNV